ncbi:hypothetical protein OHA77_07045 [Streptosporangium sp. NBC_01639]|uniref:hypothetical protein n=1 Tax=Streptosporangium sp. NBC_01639 TaxID=2975948 RepID=UPI00386D34CD|nr:hypothetical protein OHA77_07045 [Streptosporangium sp. NBC_01639]
MVVTAIVLLIAGFLLGQAFLVMWSIAVSVLSAVFLVIGALLRRHELFPSGGHAGQAPPPQGGPVPAGPTPVPRMVPDQHVSSAPHAMASQGMRQTATPQPRMSPAAGRAPAARRGLLGAKAIVLVIPGRKRYHVAGCRQLDSRDHEELTHEEAREEGFTPCTTCLPEFTGGSRPQDASYKTQEPAAPLTSSQESGTSTAAREAAAGPTARFSPPYGPVTSSSPQETAGVRPRGQGAPAAQEPVQSREQADPPLRASRPADRPAAESDPASPPQTPDDSAATSWFSRDMVESVAAASETPGSGPSGDSEDQVSAEPEESVPSGPAEAEVPDRSGGPVESGSAEAESSPVGSGGPVGPESAEAEISVGSGGSVGSGSAEAESSPVGSGAPVESEPAEAEAEAEDGAPAAPSGSGARPGPAGRKPSAEEQDSLGEPVSAEPDSTPEPVEPAETAPGRAGQPVSADSTSEETEPSTPSTDGRKAGAPEEAVDENDEDTDTAPHGIPVIQDGPKPGSPETVKVIVGTRRFHSSACPLIRGTDDDGIETMSRAEAEESGLTGCSVCQNGR